MNVSERKHGDTFAPVVLDPTGKIRGRMIRIHRRTRIQKQKLAAEAMTLGLDEMERRIAAAEAARE